MTKIHNIKPQPEYEDRFSVARRSQSLRSSLARWTHLQDESAEISVQCHPDGVTVSKQSKISIISLLEHDR